MIKKLGLALLTILFFINPSYALVINQDTDTGSLQIKYYEPVGQSFTATDTDVGYVGLMINPYNQHFNDYTVTMSLFRGEGDFSASALLISNTFTLPGGFQNWLDLDVGTISFTKDEVYTIGIFNDTEQWGVDLNWNGNPYSGGVAYYKGSGDLSDLRFHVGPQTAAVPEPSTMLLLGFGLIGLAGYGRKKLFKK